MISSSYSLQESSGDKIYLSSYHNKNAEYTTNTLSLKEEFGLSFSYKGDGIDAQDKKEIYEAMRKIKPLLDIFKADSGFRADDKSIINKAFDINSFLPTPQDENYENFIKDSLVSLMDDVLKEFEANDKVISLAKNLFDALDKQMEGFSLYA